MEIIIIVSSGFIPTIISSSTQAARDCYRCYGLYKLNTFFIYFGSTLQQQLQQLLYIFIFNTTSTTKTKQNKLHSFDTYMSQKLWCIYRFFSLLFFPICLDVPHLTNENRTQDCIAS